MHAIDVDSKPANKYITEVGISSVREHTGCQYSMHLCDIVLHAARLMLHVHELAVFPTGFGIIKAVMTSSCQSQADMCMDPPRLEY
jgi:hypothetical protein